MQVSRKEIEDVLNKAVAECDSEIDANQIKFINGEIEWYSKSRHFSVNICGVEYTLVGDDMRPKYRDATWLDAYTPKLEYDRFKIIADRRIAKRVTFKGAIDRIYNDLKAR